MQHDSATAYMYPDDYEHVPTVPELARQGLAKMRPGKKGAPSYYRVSPEGEALMKDAMHRNAQRLRAHAGR